MPTSLAHVLGGLAAAEGSPVARRWSRTRVLLFCAVVANLPDADFLPGFLVGDPVRFHREATHSLLAAVLVALAFAAWARWRGGDARRIGVLAFLVYGSHLALDALSTSPAANSGVPLFWPLPAHYYTVVPLPGPLAALLDLDLDHTTNGGFLHVLFSLHGAEVFLGHALLFAPLPIAAWLIRRGLERLTAPGPARRRRRFSPTPEPATDD